MSGLILRGVEHAYGSAPSLRGVSLNAAPGEIVCLYGPSGCGKTTLLRIIAGLERASAGEVSLDGAILAGGAVHVAPERRPIGIVFQEFALFPHMTARENIAFGLADIPPTERSARADEALAGVDLAALATRYPHEMSGGQQQRVALARALARRPRAMLLDEPFASIDPMLRRRLRAEMRAALKARAAPAVFVTHDPEEALDMGDRIVVMADGRVLEDAAPHALWSAPRTVEGAALFPGAQIIEATGVAGGYDTDFGFVAAPAERRIEGPARIVARDGGVLADPAADGAGQASDCRFHPRGFALVVQSRRCPGRAVRACAASPSPPGAGLAVRLDWALAAVFAVR